MASAVRSFGQFYSNLQRINVARSYNYTNFVRSFAKEMGLPRVFFDMSADGAAVGRIVIEVSRQRVYFAQKSSRKIADSKNVVAREKSKMVEGYG